MRDFIVKRSNWIFFVLIVLILGGVTFKAFRRTETAGPRRAARADQADAKGPYVSVAQPVLKIDAAEKKKTLSAERIFGDTTSTGK